MSSTALSKVPAYRCSMVVGVSTLCAVLGLLLLMSGTALAAPPEIPELFVLSRTATSVTVFGRLNPQAAGEAGHYEFLYKEGDNCKGGSSSPQGLTVGEPEEAHEETITGLSPGKEYTICLSVTNDHSPPETSVSAPETFRAALPPEEPEKEAASEVTASTATLHGILNPRNPGEPGTYEFLYRQSPTECQGAEEKTTPENRSRGNKREAVSAPVSELLPDTKYTFCLRARNGSRSGEPEVGALETFTTQIETYVTDVSSSGATLHAAFDPEGADTTYRFEGAIGGGEFAPVRGPSGELLQGAEGSASAGLVPVEVHVQGLAADTYCRFRLVVSRSGETVTGPGETFTTQPPGGSLTLLDGRQWEMVSPPDKNGALVVTAGTTYEGVFEAAADGNAFTYFTNIPTESEPPGFANDVQVLSTRAPGGWSSQDIALPHDAGTGVTEGGGLEYRFFSTDLSRALVEQQGEFTPLTGEEASPQATERTPYLREDSTCQAMPARCYTPLVTSANVPPGTRFGKVTEEGGGAQVKEGEVYPVGGTNDLSHVVLESAVPLTKEAPKEESLYEWADGQLQLVSVLPASEGGSPASDHAQVKFGASEGDVTGEFGSETRNAISEAGSRIVWSTREALYMRDTARKETVRIGGTEAEFAEASSDASRVFFVEGGARTEHGEEGGDLYVFEVTSSEGEPLAGTITRLTEGAEVDGAVLGASEDGSYVYFVANGVLGDGAEHGATPGTGECRQNHPESICNLYVEHYDGRAWEAPRFIAALSGADGDDWEFGELLRHTSRSSPDGRYLAFMSRRPLIGYDNADAVSGAPDEEVYLYDADANGDRGGLSCVSCDPTGARPVGEPYSSLEETLVGAERVWKSSTWLAASVPGWNVYEKAYGANQPRYLSNSGRLFFDSYGALVPQDVNGTWDVYEYEPPGIGSCTVSSTTFSEHSGGCVGLISSGESGEESGFLDASENGDDVFFLTAQRLVAQDVDDNYDVYDAHECTGESPCLPTPAEQPPACTTEASCKPAPELQPSIYGPPSSATFAGPGNFAPARPAPAKPKTAAEVKAEKLANALKRCRRDKSMRKKAKCEKQARGRYGSAKSKTKAKKSSNDRRDR